MRRRRLTRAVAVLGLAALGAACRGPSHQEVAASTRAAQGGAVVTADDELAPWRSGAWHGANIYQRRTLSGIDDPADTGGAAFLPSYQAGDFADLARSGANLVVLSHPGIFTEQAPYRLDPAAVANLDGLIGMARDAGLHVVISFRSGPGRNELTFERDEAGTWFSRAQLVETVWHDPAAQQAWADMWADTARRYRDDPTVVGYELMVEANASAVLGVEDPAHLHQAVAGTAADWSALAARLAGAVRAVDDHTPVLVGPDGWAAPSFLGTFTLPSQPALVLAVHLYEPDAYLYGEDDRSSAADAARTWSAELARAAGTAEESGVPIAVTEYGVDADAPDAAAFITAAGQALSAQRASSAIWMWEPAQVPWDRDSLGLGRGRSASDPRRVALSESWAADR